MRKNVSNTLDEELYDQIRILAIRQKKNANDLIEEGMRLILDKYKDNTDKNTPN